jgi:hypothetical protein
MNNGLEDTYFVIYNPKNIMYFTDEAPFMGFVKSGYYIVPYVTHDAKMLFKGSYLQCMLVWNGLNSFNLN